ncbi:MAG: CsgG/HfaB family protein [Dehalococcoidales bacterium]|jgi:curli biogenesis system outer membrane secretion channel CsgG
MKKAGLVLATVLVLQFMVVTSCHALESLKKTVAVFDFQNDSGFSGYVNLGQDFGTQLSDALVQSGKFIVLSRQDLVPVMAEQEMANSDRFAQSGTAKLGKIVPAQLLVKGKVTEFQETKSGGGQGLQLYGVSIKTSKSSAHVAVIIQLIDSTTGQIVESQRVEGDVSASGTSLGYSGAVNFGSSEFQKTPLGKAVQMAIDKAVEYIAAKSSAIPWSGKVMLVKDGVIYVNSGTNAGIKTGDAFFVSKAGEVLIDPDTGMELGRENKKLGQIQITEVQEKFSKAIPVSTLAGEASKGDLVAEK